MQEPRSENSPRKGLASLAAPWSEYAGDDDDIPMAGYAAIAAVFAAGLGSVLATLGRRRRLPREWSARDLVLTGLATHRLSRIITRDRITIPLRAPLTRYEGSAGAGEVRERVRVHGAGKVVASLVTCPYCAGPWIASAMMASMAVAPRVTRFVQGMLASVAVSDFAHQAYAALKKLS